MNFEFATAARIVFGPGRVTELGVLAREYGQRLVLFTGRQPDRFPAVRRAFADAGLCPVAIPWIPASSEPDLASVLAWADRVREVKAECIVAVGGGGVLDAAKAVAAFATNPGDPFAHLEVIGRGEPLRFAPLPVIAVPTTAGTGSEVTRNAVLTVSEHRAKVSLRHPLMLPRVALVDPQLTHSLPPDLTASTGMDALTQCLESLVCTRANPLSDAVAWAGLRRAARSLHRAFAVGEDAAAREDMAVASLCGGLALANAGLGAVHGLAGPLGGMFSVPHGALCAALLAPVMTANIRALRERYPESSALARYTEIAGILTGNKIATAENGVDWVWTLAQTLGIIGLKDLGVDIAAFSLVADKAASASSMKANPIGLTPAELMTVLYDSVFHSRCSHAIPH